MKPIYHALRKNGTCPSRPATLTRITNHLKARWRGLRKNALQHVWKYVVYYALSKAGRYCLAPSAQDIVIWKTNLSMGMAQFKLLTSPLSSCQNLAICFMAPYPNGVPSSKSLLIFKAQEHSKRSQLLNKRKIHLGGFGRAGCLENVELQGLFWYAVGKDQEVHWNRQENSGKKKVRAYEGCTNCRAVLLSWAELAEYFCARNLWYTYVVTYLSFARFIISIFQIFLVTKSKPVILSIRIQRGSDDPLWILFLNRRRGSSTRILSDTESTCNRFCREDKRFGFTRSMVPFVEKFQPTRFENWLNGEDSMCPMSVHLGGEPVVPAAPSFEDLVSYKGDSPLVNAMKLKLDRFGKKEENLKKRYEQLIPEFNFFQVFKIIVNLRFECQAH